jgi:hypothetical protein
VQVTPANVQERPQGAQWAAQGPHVPGDTVERADGDQGDRGDQAAPEAEAHHRQREVVTLPEAQQGCVLRPRRWVGERSGAWAGRFRRRARDYEQWAETRAGLHFVAFAIRRRKRVVALLV